MYFLFLLLIINRIGRVNTRTYLVWTEKGRKFIHDLAHRFWELAELFEVKNL